MNAADSIEKQHPCFVAVDLGASSGRVIAAQLREGHLSLQEVNRFSIAFAKDQHSGYFCWGIDAIEESVRKGIEEASLLAPIASIGVDSWGVDYVLLDAQLQRVGQAICYRDDRTQGKIEQVTARMSRAEIYRRTGMQFQPFNTIYQLAAMAEQEPEWVGKTRHLLMIPDYVHFRLCGVLANEYTDATTTQLLNLDGAWDRDLFEAAGLKQIWMQPPVAAGSVLGEARIGSRTAKVVAGTTHDTASAVVGTPFEADTEIFLSSGTWSLMGVESVVPYASEQALKWNFGNEGGYGRRFRVLKNIMGLWLLQRITQEFQIPIDDALLSATADAAPWRSIVNPDDGRFLNPDSMKQVIAEYCVETRQPAPETAAQFARCALESLALTYRLVKEQLESLRGQSLTRIRIVGGGSKNRLLNQLCANACQLPVSAGPVEASALGNICSQMIALGEIQSIDAARALIRRSFEINEYRPLEPIPDSVWKKFQQFVTPAMRKDVQ
jgi:rhamnulokinase